MSFLLKNKNIPDEYDNLDTYEFLTSVEDPIVDRLYYITSENKYYRWSPMENFVVAISEDEISMLKIRVTNNETKIAALEVTDSIHTNELLNLNSEMLQVKSDLSIQGIYLDSKKADKTDLDLAKTDLDSKIMTTNNNVSLLESRVTTTENNITQLDTNINQLDTKINTEVTNIGYQIISLNNTTSVHQLTLLDHSVAINNNKTDIEALKLSEIQQQTDLNDHEIRISQIEDVDIPQLKTRVSNTEVQINTINATLDIATLDIFNNKNKIDTLDNRITIHDSQINSINGVLNVHGSDINNLNTTVAALDPRIGIVEGQLNNVNTTLTQHTSDINNINSSISNLDMRTTSNTGNIGLINTNLTTINNKITTNTNNITTNTTDIATNTANISTNTSNITALQNTKEEKLTIGKNLIRTGNSIAVTDAVALTGNLTTNFISTGGMTSTGNVNAPLLNSFSGSNNVVINPNNIEFRESSVTVATIDKNIIGNVNSKVDTINNTDTNITLSRTGNTVTVSAPKITTLTTDVATKVTTVTSNDAFVTVSRTANDVKISLPEIININTKLNTLTPGAEQSITFSIGLYDPATLIKSSVLPTTSYYNTTSYKSVAIKVTTKLYLVNMNALLESSSWTSTGTLKPCLVCNSAWLTNSGTPFPVRLITDLYNDVSNSKFFNEYLYNNDFIYCNKGPNTNTLDYTSANNSVAYKHCRAQFLITIP